MAGETTNVSISPNEMITTGSLENTRIFNKHVSANQFSNESYDLEKGNFNRPGTMFATSTNPQIFKMPMPTLTGKRGSTSVEPHRVERPSLTQPRKSTAFHKQETARIASEKKLRDTENKNLTILRRLNINLH